MKKSFKRSIAVICAAAALCTPLSNIPVFSNTIIAPAVANAADLSELTSGSTNKNYFYLNNEEAGYTLWFSIKDPNARTAVVTGCTTRKDSVCIDVPDTAAANYNGISYTIVGIGDNAFRDQDRITNVKLQKHIEEIGSFAFAGCTNLSNFYVEPTKYRGNEYLLTKISYKAFIDCQSLTCLSFMNNVTDVGEYAFYNCTALTSLVAPSLTSMGNAAFSCCYSLSDIILSDSSLTYIPDNAFQYSCSDRSIECNLRLPSTIQSIGRCAFNNVNGIRKIYIPNVTSIGDSAFEDCHELKTVLTGDNLYWIGSYAFSGCDPMRYFVCKNDYVSLGTNALGYDNMRNYRGKKNTFTLWGTSNNSGLKRYADNNGFTYRKVSEAADLASKRYVDYEWAQPNVGSFWGENFKYYLNSAHRPYVSQDITNKSFDGICAGLATVSALTANGYLQVSDFAPGYEKISDILYYGMYIPSKVKSYVTAVWANSAQSYSYDYATGINGTLGDEMLKYAEHITYGADTAVFVTEKHAMVCFGVEFKQYAADKNDPCWNGWDARLMIYDVNNFKYNGKAHNKYDYVYVNLSDGSSSYPFPDIYGTSHTYKLIHTPYKMISQNLDEFFPAIRN